MIEWLIINYSIIQHPYVFRNQSKSTSKRSGQEERERVGRSILNYPREVGHPIFFIGIGTHLKHYDNHCFFFHNNKSLDNTKTFGNEFKFCIH